MCIGILCARPDKEASRRNSILLDKQNDKYSPILQFEYGSSMFLFRFSSYLFPVRSFSSTPLRRLSVQPGNSWMASLRKIVSVFFKANFFYCTFYCKLLWFANWQESYHSLITESPIIERANDGCLQPERPVTAPVSPSSARQGSSFSFQYANSCLQFLGFFVLPELLNSSGRTLLVEHAAH